MVKKTNWTYRRTCIHCGELYPTEARKGTTCNVCKAKRQIEVAERCFQKALVTNSRVNIICREIRKEKIENLKLQLRRGNGIPNC
jgi:hypothetical protein